MTQAWNETKVADNRLLTLFFNAFRLRCPVCKEGRFLIGWFGVLEQCPACGVDASREDGYFLGSIYFNYGATGLLSTAAYLTGKFVLNLPDVWLISTLAAFTFVFPLFFLRYARASWMAFDQYFGPRRPPTADAQQPVARSRR